MPSITSSGPTRKRSDFTSIPGEPFGADSASFLMICGASIESSLAHTLVTTFTTKTPRSRAMGLARSAIRGPTAARQ